MKFKKYRPVFLGYIVLGLFVNACSHEPAPNYENRLDEIGIKVVRLSEEYNSSLSYRDTILDFAYGNNELYFTLYNHKFRSDSVQLEVGNGPVGDFNDQDGAVQADYFIKFIQGKKEVWLRLKYNRGDDKFYMVGYHTERGRL